MQDEPRTFGGYDIYHEIDGRPLLKAVTLEVPAGKTIGLAGPHGTGKSLLAAILSGRVKPILGDITLPPAEVACIHPEIEQDLRLTVENWLEYRAACRGLRATTPWQGPDPLSPLGLTDLRSRRLGDCSRWERMLIEVAAAAVTTPAVWILDLPLGDLSEEGQHLFDTWIEQQSSVLLVHARAEILQPRCDDAFWLEDGRLRSL